MKICRICKQEKELNDFHKKKDTIDGHRNECKDCTREILRKYKEGDENIKKRKKYDKERYDEKREEILEQKKQYHIENRKTILEKKKVYRDTHKEEIKNWRENNKDRNAIGQLNYRKRHPHIVAWRSILYSTLKRLGTEKEGHTIDILGYSALDLKLHMEKLFREGMSWENHGEWHIDHIKPVTAFDSSTPVKEVCALGNLQPLWENENLTKLNNFSFFI